MSSLIRMEDCVLSREYWGSQSPTGYAKAGAVNRNRCYIDMRASVQARIQRSRNGQGTSRNRVIAVRVPVGQGRRVPEVGLKVWLFEARPSDFVGLILLSTTTTALRNLASIVRTRFLILVPRAPLGPNLARLLSLFTCSSRRSRLDCSCGASSHGGQARVLQMANLFCDFDTKNGVIARHLWPVHGLLTPMSASTGADLRLQMVLRCGSAGLHC